MRHISITRLPDDLWGRADQLLHYSPVIKGRTDQRAARQAIYHELQRGSIDGLREALTQFCLAYRRDIHGRLIPLARNHFVNEARQLGRDIEHWLEGERSQKRAEAA